GRGGSPLAVIGAGLALAAPGAARASDPLPLRPPGQPGKLGNERLSDEKTVTRFAVANRRVTARSRPSSHARAIVKLHWYTEENFDELYIVLQSRRSEGET